MYSIEWKKSIGSRRQSTFPEYLIMRFNRVINENNFNPVLRKLKTDDRDVNTKWRVETQYKGKFLAGFGRWDGSLLIKFIWWMTWLCLLKMRRLLIEGYRITCNQIFITWTDRGQYSAFSVWPKITFPTSVFLFEICYIKYLIAKFSKILTVLWRKALSYRN